MKLSDSEWEMIREALATKIRLLESYVNKTEEQWRLIWNYKALLNRLDDYLLSR